MARPLKEINWDIVEKRMEAGNSAKTIAQSFHIDTDTFYRRFKAEYGGSFGDYTAIFYECGDANIDYTQYMKALSGNVEMLKWLGKIRRGQVENPNQEINQKVQEEIDKDHVIMQLKNKITILEENADKSKTG